jgi:hypothetical protein
VVNPLLSFSSVGAMSYAKPRDFLPYSTSYPSRCKKLRIAKTVYKFTGIDPGENIPSIEVDE